MSDIKFTKEEISEIYKLLEQIDCCSDVLKDETIRNLTLDIRTIIDPVYCPTCGACGETGDGCHNRCESLSAYHLFINLEQYLLEKERQFFKSENNRPNIISKIIDDLKSKLYITEENGLYCDSYIKSYNDMQAEYNELYDACKILMQNLSKREESDSGTEFSPNYISSCRILDGIEIGNSMKVINKILGITV